MLQLEHERQLGCVSQEALLWPQDPQDWDLGMTYKSERKNKRLRQKEKNFQNYKNT